MITTKEITPGLRLGSMLLDHIFMVLIGLVFFIPLFYQSVEGLNSFSNQKLYTDPTEISSYITFFAFAFYLSKDSFNGRSIAKRITNLQIIDVSSGNVASPLQCLIRNIFCIIWPIEVFVVIFKPSRRIGDRVAGTMVVNYDPDFVEQSNIDTKKILLPFIYSYFIMVLLLWLI